MRIVKVFYLFLISLLGNNLLAQEVRVEATCDSSSIRIGEQTKLHLKVSIAHSNKSTSIQWPHIVDTLTSKIEVVSISKVDTLVPDKSQPNNFTQSIHLTITAFDSGYFPIPPFSIVINNDTAHPYLTEPLLLQVRNVPVDTTKGIKDIKPPLQEPFKWTELVPYLYGIAGLAALVLLGIYLYKKYGKKVAPVVEVALPKVPPHVIALEALEKLKQEQLWQGGKIKPYYSKLSDILRLYLEQRYKINALEQTTDEIMATLRLHVIDETSKHTLQHILIVSDLVKFAKEEPLANENESCMENAKIFIEGTAQQIT